MDVVTGVARKGERGASRHGNERCRNAVGWFVKWRFEKCRFKRWMCRGGLRPRRGLFLYLLGEFRSFERKPGETHNSRPTLGSFFFLFVLFWLIIVTGRWRTAIHFLSDGIKDSSFSSPLWIAVDKYLYNPHLYLPFINIYQNSCITSELVYTLCYIFIII